MKYELLFPLLVMYQFKHLLADYPLQNSYMLGKFKSGWDFVQPLLAHVGVHGCMTVLIAIWAGAPLLLAVGLGLLDATIHFGMDRLKAGPKYMGRWKALSGAEYMRVADNLAWYGARGASPDMKAVADECRRLLRNNTYFWWALGFDQFVHHLTHYAIIWILVTS